MFEDKLKSIETEAKKAIQNNDLVEAWKVKEKKETVERLVMFAWELEFKKSQAIEDEDFDQAKILK